MCLHSVCQEIHTQSLHNHYIGDPDMIVTHIMQQDAASRLAPDGRYTFLITWGCSSLSGWGGHHGLAHPCSQDSLLSTHTPQPYKHWDRVTCEVAAGKRSQCLAWRECSKQPALGSAYTWRSSVACAWIVCVRKYIHNHYVTTTNIIKSTV